MQEILSKKILGERFKLLRLERGNSQLVTADLLNISRSNYSQIELGKQFPTYETLIRAARYYNKSYEWMLHGNDYVEKHKFPQDKTPNSGPEMDIIINDVKKVKASAKSKWVLIDREEKQNYVQNAFDEQYISRLPSYETPVFSSGDVIFRAFTMDDQSMYPILCQDDIVISCPITQYSEIILNNIYVIVTTTNILIRKINIYSSEKNVFICKSDNPNQPPITIEASDVLQVWKAVSKFSTELFSIVEHLKEEMRKIETIISDLQKKMEGVNYKSSVS